MKIEIKIPEVGESVQEAVLAQWYKRDGEQVRKDEILYLIETDKVTLEISAEADGVLHILVPEGETVSIGAVVGTIDTAAGVEAKARGPEEEHVAQKPAEEPEEQPAATPLAPPAAAEEIGVRAPEAPAKSEYPEYGQAPYEGLSPSVRRLVAEKGLDPRNIRGTGPGNRITKGDVLRYIEKMEAPVQVERPEVGAAKKAVEQPAAEGVEGDREAEPEGEVRRLREPPRVQAPVEPPTGKEEEATTRRPMSRIRLKIAERLLEARQTTAMLTTFNEIDMSRVQETRNRFKESFRKKYGVSLGIMSFFIKASIVALREFPEVNAFIDGSDIIYHHYYHIGIAVGGERGLVVPVIRHADRLTFAEIEQSIVDYVEKVRENRLEISDLEGGTFTISNGGVYGSLLSTPILNPPQSGILGMHKIEDRPVVRSGQVMIRPMMYVALSYDHRIVDGREAVTFLKRIKECVENPERIMMEI